MNKTKSLAVLACAVVATGTFGSPAASATQMGDQYRCNAGNVCVWQDAGFNGGLAQFGLTKLNYQYEIYDNGLSVNDSVSSIFNRSNDPINFYRHSGANIGDLCFKVQPGSTVYDLAGSGCDNTLSSHYSANL